MQIMKFAGSVLLASLLVACSSSNQPSNGGAPVENRNGGTSDSTGKVDDGKMAQVNLDNQNGDKMGAPAGSVFFDYDQYSVKDEFKALIEAHAAFLKKNGVLKLLVQGNADERGSREYNLSLGQKRANAVKEALELLGADGSRVEAVSLGEEKPRCEEKTEECYGQNRRADFVYQGQ